MNDYVILTDATCDLPANIVEEYNINVLPLSFTIEGKEYRNYYDEREYKISDFYQKLREGKTSSTSQINQNDFIEAGEKILSEGKDVLYIGFSSSLSGTFHSGVMAGEELTHKYPERKFVCVDTLAASVGEGMLVYYAAKMKAQGKDIHEVAKWVEENKLKLCHWFTVDDLHHLKRGGRVSSMAAIMGTALGIKPVLHVNDEGKLIPKSKVRGRKKALEIIFNKFEETAINPEEQVLFIGHGDSLDDAVFLSNLIRSKYKVKDIIISDIGPVIGSHSGPGTIALFFFGTHR